MAVPSGDELTLSQEASSIMSSPPSTTSQLPVLSGISATGITAGPPSSSVPEPRSIQDNPSNEDVVAVARLVASCPSILNSFENRMLMCNNTSELRSLLDHVQKEKNQSAAAAVATALQQISSGSYYAGTYGPPVYSRNLTSSPSFGIEERGKRMKVVEDEDGIEVLHHVTPEDSSSDDGKDLYRKRDGDSSLDDTEGNENEAAVVSKELGLPRGLTWQTGRSSFQASIFITGKQIYKIFSTKRLGNEKALELARKWLKEMVERRDQGQGWEAMHKEGLFGRKPSNTGIRGITWQESRMKFQCSIYMSKGNRVQKYFPTGLNPSGPKYEEAFKQAKDWMEEMELRKAEQEGSVMRPSRLEARGERGREHLLPGRLCEVIPQVPSGLMDGPNLTPTPPLPPEVW